jgi:hypothetical protein
MLGLKEFKTMNAVVEPSTFIMIPTDLLTCQATTGSALLPPFVVDATWMVFSETHESFHQLAYLDGNSVS